MVFTGTVHGQRFEEICTISVQITGEGNVILFLENVDIEDAMERLLALAEGADDLLMCLRNMLT